MTWINTAAGSAACREHHGEPGWCQAKCRHGRQRVSVSSSVCDKLSQPATVGRRHRLLRLGWPVYLKE